MEISPFRGKPLTTISVFEPWKVRGGPIGLPLFGAITLEFGDVALLFKSPLRYARADQPAPGGLRKVVAALRPIVCDLDQLGFYRRLLQGRASETQPFFWQTGLPESRNCLALDNPSDSRRLVGQTLLGMNPVSDTVIELRFSGQDFPTWLTYREDLDGAIQMAWAGWHHEIAEIVVSEPEHAFGWLHPEAPYPISVKGKLWPTMGRYVEFAAWQVMRGPFDPGTKSDDALLAIHEEALRLKFEAHLLLARRFAALRYPIIGDGLDGVAIQALTRLRAAYSTIPAS